MRPTCGSLTLSALLLAAGCAAPDEPYTVQPAERADFPQGAEDAGVWPGWGGPRGDFHLVSAPLAEAWPPEGPPLLWSRPLGEGYSGIVAGRGVLATMYRDGDQDVVVALRASDGRIVWDGRYDAPTRPGNQTRFGSGPNATPLLLEDRLITLGYSGRLEARRITDGAPLWSLNLIEDLGGEVLEFGYSASPVLHGGLVLVLVGGQNAVVALDPAAGSVRWRSEPGSVSYATPIVIDVDGQQQIVYMSADEVIGLDTSSGELLWRHPCVNQYRNNATAPLWRADDGLLWVATQLDGGTRVLRLDRSDGGTRVEQVWSGNKISIHFWNAVRLENHVYASIGGNASVLAAVDVRTGEIAWRRRGFEQANLLQVGDRTLLLDGEGHLALVTLSPEDLVIHSEARVVEDTTWTPPILVGTALYVRDKRSIRAFDLSRSSPHSQM